MGSPVSFYPTCRMGNGERALSGNLGTGRFMVSTIVKSCQLVLGSGQSSGRGKGVGSALLNPLGVACLSLLHPRTLLREPLGLRGVCFSRPGSSNGTRFSSLLQILSRMLWVQTFSCGLRRSSWVRTENSARNAWGGLCTPGFGQSAALGRVDYPIRLVLLIAGGPPLPPLFDGS